MKFLRSKRFWHVMKRLAQGLGIVVLVSILLGIWHHHHISQQALRELERVRERGEPLTPADLREIYPITEESKEVTERWLAVLDELASMESQQRKFDLSFESNELAGKEIDLVRWEFTEEDNAIIEEYLLEADDPLRRAAEILRGRPEIRYPIDFDQWLEGYDPPSGLRELPDALRLHIIQDVRKGDTDDVEHSVALIQDAAETLHDVPDTIFQLTRLTMLNTSRHLIRQSAARSDLTDVQLARMQSRLLQYDSGHVVKMGFWRERVGGQLLFEEDQQIAPNIPAWTIRFRRADQAAYHHWITRFIDAGQHEFNFEVAGAAQVDYVREHRGSGVLGWFTDRRYLSTRLLLPATQAYFAACDRAYLDSRATAILVACQRYRLREGRFPDTLDELPKEIMPVIPRDPFNDGEHYVYKVQDDRVIVYSIGSNEVDDGGVGPNWDFYEGDIVFTMFTKPAE